MDELLGALDERLEIVDRVVLKGSQVRVTFYGEEVEPIELVRINRATYTSRFDLYFEANICAVTC